MDLFTDEEEGEQGESNDCTHYQLVKGVLKKSIELINKLWKIKKYIILDFHTNVLIPLKT